MRAEGASTPCTDDRVSTCTYELPRASSGPAHLVGSADVCTNISMKRLPAAFSMIFCRSEIQMAGSSSLNWTRRMASRSRSKPGVKRVERLGRDEARGEGRKQRDEER